MRVKERVGECKCVRKECVFVCMRERERERMSKCVFVCERKILIVCVRD